MIVLTFFCNIFLEDAFSNKQKKAHFLVLNNKYKVFIGVAFIYVQNIVLTEMDGNVFNYTRKKEMGYIALAGCG